MIKLPASFYDDLEMYKEKGCILNLEVNINGDTRIFNFYDIVRFIQTINDDINNYGFFYESNTVIINDITEKNILIFLESIRK